MTENLSATQPIELVVSPKSFHVVTEFLENNGIAYVISVPDLQKSVNKHAIRRFQIHTSSISLIKCLRHISLVTVVSINTFFHQTPKLFKLFFPLNATDWQNSWHKPQTHIICVHQECHITFLSLENWIAFRKRWVNCFASQLRFFFVSRRVWW